MMQLGLRRSNYKQWISYLVNVCRPRDLLPNLMAGLIIGVLVIIFSVSLASLVFAGPLAPFMPFGIVLTLFGAMLIGLVITLFSSFSGTIAAPQEAPAAILALIAASIFNTMPTGATEAETFFTVMAAIALSSVLTGLLFLVLGYYRWGALVRFLPYPVVGGFLAGTGWLLVTGAITVMTDLPLTLSTLPHLLQPELGLRWLPALLFAGLLLMALNRYSHVLLMPGMILGAVLLFYGIAWLSGMSVTALGEQGWLTELPTQPLSQSLTMSDLAHINWAVILNQTGNVITIMSISVVALLLNASGLELVVKQDIDLNRELRVAGVGNILCGLGGGLLGFHLLSESTLSYKIGGRSRVVGLVAVGVCALVLFGGLSLLYFVPKLILGSLLMLLGLSFLVEWVYEAWFKFSLIDYLIILTILIVIVLVGFLEGVVLGIGLTVLLFVFNYSRINVVKQLFSGATYQSRVTRRRAHRQILRQKGAEILILQLQGFIFFGTAHNLLEQVRHQLQVASLTRVRYLVLDFGEVIGLDSTAVRSFSKMIQLARTNRSRLIFTKPLNACNLPGQHHTIAKFFEQLDDIEGGQPEKIVHVFPDLDHGLEWCENQILLAAGADLNDLTESLDFLFSSLLPDTPDLDRLLKYFERLDVDSGYYLTRAGDPPGDLFFIEAGDVTAQLEFPDRSPIRLETMGGGRVVGEIGFYLSQPRTAAVVTDTPSTIHRLSRQTLQQMERHDPEAAALFHQGIIRLLAERLAHTTSTVNILQR